MLGADSEGRVLIPRTDGLSVVDPAGGTRFIGRPGGLRTSVYVAFEDREGSVWLGLAGHGLARWLGYRQWEAFTETSGLTNEVVYEILPRPDGSVLAGTEGGLAIGARDDQGAWKWRMDERIGKVPVHAVQSDRTGNIWLGMESKRVARLDSTARNLRWPIHRPGAFTASKALHPSAAGPWQRLRMAASGSPPSAESTVSPRATGPTSTAPPAFSRTPCWP
ncbi:MAG: hypothetical protein NTY38_08885 [Acidobacteria bacterium]|nr:hypothetical protein [Acidobacteriota bacterium]